MLNMLLLRFLLYLDTYFMKTYIFSLYILILFSSFCNAQTASDDVLLTIDDTPIYTSEFIRVYNKNLELVKDESQKNVDEYLKLFIDYKLKIAEARILDFDKKKEFKKELNTYRNQLAKKHLTNTNVTEKLVKEAYERAAYDIKAKHILIKIEEFEKDTIKAYSEILKLRDRFINEDFDDLKSELHNGSTVFVEDLGYFSGFQMVYNFETMAYNTKVGEVSKPFRTQFGYHVVKVFDKKPYKGKVTVGQIMIRQNQKDLLVNPEQRINEIYKLIEQGENFETLAKQFSEDKNTAIKGGRLAPFTSGQLRLEIFEEQAFLLNKNQNLSKPFKTEFGWHIIKFYSKEILGSLEEMKGSLETKIKRDSRSKFISNALVKQLIKDYNLSYKNLELDNFNKFIKGDSDGKNWMILTDLPINSTLFQIKSQNYTYNDFAEYLKAVKQKNNSNLPLKDLINTLYQNFVNESVLQYHEQNLEKVDVDFSNLLLEFEEGLLLFELMENKIWNVAETDSLKIKIFYDTNKSSYVLEERIDAIIATSSKQKVSKLVRKLLKKNEGEQTIKEIVNKDGKQNVILTKRELTKTNSVLPKTFKFKKGISKVFFHNDAYHVVKVNRIQPKRLQTFKEAKGAVISDYQKEKELKMLKTLASKYKIDVNQNVLSTIKTQLTVD